MENDILYILLGLILIIVIVRYVELQNLIKAIGRQTDALSLYVSEQHALRVETRAEIKVVQEAASRIETKIDAVHRILHRLDRRKSTPTTTEEDTM